MTGYGATAEAYFEHGWMPLPLPHGQKTPPPNGTTGSAGRDVSYSDVVAWVEDHKDGNVALRLPRGVVGIDVDAYKPNALVTMGDLTQTCGPLPATWRSGAREAPSGIYFFRAPDDITGIMRDPRPRPGEKSSDVELIRWNHRYVVVAPSKHPDTGGHYAWFRPDGSHSQDRPPHVDELPWLPQAWIEALTSKTSEASAGGGIIDLSKADAYETRIVESQIAKLRSMRDAATPSGQGYNGPPWDQTTYDVAARLTEVANADWSALTHDTVEAILLEHGPQDGNFDAGSLRAKLRSARTRIGSKAANAPTGGNRVDDSSLFASHQGGAPATVSGDVSAGQPGSRRVIEHGNMLNVNNLNEVVAWLRDNLGTGPLSGVFFRKGALVHTPRIDEDGYVPVRDMIGEGAASISTVDNQRLRARIQHRYNVVRVVEDKKATAEAQKADPGAGTVWKSVPEIFPLEAATIAVSAPDDMLHLRELKSVVHTPTFRADGTLITAPGYDEASRSLFLPTGGQPGPIPDRPTMQDRAVAKQWIDYMLTDFRFVSDSDRANYIGLLLTPILRAIVPSPYKLGVIEAHQPGSGKTFLARALCSIHGGLMHAEMPEEEPELVKTIASVLDAQTAPVVVFDNVTGLVKSPTLAGLLTSPTFQARRLGGNSIIEADNDRLWVITANNAQLGGDLARRNIRARLDPGVPEPEQRTQFTIMNFEGWVREHRGDLLWSLLTLVRAWITDGAPMPNEVRQDSYGMWSAVIQGVLTSAGIPGEFDDGAGQREFKDPETEEWEALLGVIEGHFQGRPWTAKTLLSLFAHPLAGLADPTKPFAYDLLPSGLTAKSRSAEPTMLSKSFGRYLMNREGRWYGELTVRDGGKERDKTRLWRIERHTS